MIVLIVVAVGPDAEPGCRGGVEMLAAGGDVDGASTPLRLAARIWGSEAKLWLSAPRAAAVASSSSSSSSMARLSVAALGKTIRVVVDDFLFASLFWRSQNPMSGSTESYSEKPVSGSTRFDEEEDAAAPVAEAEDEGSLNIAERLRLSSDFPPPPPADLVGEMSRKLPPSSASLEVVRLRPPAGSLSPSAVSTPWQRWPSYTPAMTAWPWRI